ncbi:MAG TPA: phosphate ABC transporter substrate-binding protein PstS [Patescibacteria group bacterium]|nr:phosphate ABC transporter substrate-binding protein PstS [Patescibacteria group bacterium]
MMRSLKQKIVVAALAFSACGIAPAADVVGAGSTFVYPVMAKWSADYRAATQTKINYQAIGSGGGIAQIKARTVDFGASDKPLDANELSAAGLVQFPLVIGGVVPVVNVAGVTPGGIRFNGAVLADIFLGKIKRWNDAAIAALNPGLTLPDQAITVVHRSDGSGTTFNFTNYLSKVNTEWKTKAGEGISVRWPVGIGGKGNEGVAAYVKQIKGGIGYVELTYALQSKMSYALMQNAAGEFVSPNEESFQAAADSADWDQAQDFNLVITNAPGAKAWPIAATVFVMMNRQPKNAENAKAALAYFDWVFANGAQQASALHYVSLPAKVQAQAKAHWTTALKY